MLLVFVAIVVIVVIVVIVAAATAKAEGQCMFLVFLVGGDSSGDDGRGVGAEMC